jgi:hypothetical protein
MSIERIIGRRRLEDVDGGVLGRGWQQMEIGGEGRVITER